MENSLKTLPKAPVQSPTTVAECKTPPTIQQSMDENDQNSLNELRKSLTPDHLKVPKAFKYQERYTSPTDLMVSPVTKGILARGRKGGTLLPPSRNQPNVPITACFIALPLESFNLFGHCIAKFLDLPQEVENQEPMEIDEKLNKNLGNS